MFQGLILHNGHDSGNAKTIVSTEGSSLCLNPLTVNPSLDRVGLEVVGRIRSFLRNHIHVSLKHHGLTVLHAWRGRLTHNDIVGRILESLYANFLGEVEKELLNFLKMSRRTWHLCECIEIAPDAFWLKVFNFAHG